MAASMKAPAALRELNAAPVCACVSMAAMETLGVSKIWTVSTAINPSMVTTTELDGTPNSVASAPW